MAPRYDLVVIGTGVAASVAAARCRAARWRVAVIDDQPFGGTCALRGCDPKRVLLGAAEAVDRVRRLRGKGVADIQEPGVVWPELMAFKRGFTDSVPQARAERFAQQGIDAFRGVARFADRTAVTVGKETLTARHVLIATGAEPSALDIEGAEHVVTSDAFLDLDRLPPRILLVGGGYIAFELAHLARRAGADGTVLERGKELLAPFDRTLVDRLVRKSASIGIRIGIDTEVKAVERTTSGYLVHTSGEAGEATHETDLVVHAAGRAPAIARLDLDAAGIAHARGRLELNGYLQSTSNPAVYAAGDAAQQGPPLTPVASRDGETAAANMLEGNHAEVDYRGVPSVVFTIPPLAAVGLREEQARERGLEFRVNSADTARWYTHRRVGEDAAGHKVLIEHGSGRILGAHLLGTGAEELVNLFALAIRSRLSASELGETMFAYPTAASDLSHMLAEE